MKEYKPITFVWMLLILLFVLANRARAQTTIMGPGVELIGYGQTSGYLPDWWAQTRAWRGSLDGGRLTICFEGPQEARWVTDLSQSAMTIWLVQGRITDTPRRDLTVAEWQRCFAGAPPSLALRATGEPAYHTVWYTTAGAVNYAEMNLRQRNNLGQSVAGTVVPPAPGIPGFCLWDSTTINGNQYQRVTPCK